MSKSASKSIRYNYNVAKRYPTKINDGEYPSMARLKVSGRSNRLMYWHSDLGYIDVREQDFMQYQENTVMDTNLSEESQRMLDDWKQENEAVSHLPDDVQQAFEEHGIVTALDYLMFAARTIREYLGWYATPFEDKFINGEFQIDWECTINDKMLDMWTSLRDMSAAVKKGDSGEAIAVLAWVNHLDHCGGNLLQDHGRLDYVAINAISEDGLDSVFGDSLWALIDLIESNTSVSVSV